MTTKQDPTIGCRTIRVGGKIFVNVEDIAFVIRAFGESEETDVRNRCNELADNFIRLYDAK
jgi:hypothetical protein